MSIFLFSCSTTEFSHPVVSDGSRYPRVASTQDGGLLMSWFEKTDSINWALRWSEFVDGYWTKSKTITSNYSFNINTKNIGIAPFAKHQTKVYPLDLMQTVVSSLSKYYNIHLFGFGDELIILEKWSKAYQNVQCPSKSITFSEELQIISNLDLMISMDSGNGHLSSIYGIPTITVWGLTHPYLGFKPFLMDDNNQLGSNRDKFPLIPNSVYGNKTIKGYEGAMRSIRPKEIIDRAQEILS